MKIRLSELRQIIKEVVESELDEMALASISKTVRDPRNKNTPKDAYYDTDESDEEFRKIDRFHRTPKFSKESESSFNLLGIPIHIVPVYTTKYMRAGRTGIVPLEQALPMIEEAGFDAKKLEEDLAGGACVILSHVRSLMGNYLPTSWMMLHALFDNQSSKNPFGKLTGQIEKFIEELYKKGINKGLTHREVSYGLLGTLSMKSARVNMINIDAINDWAAELCTQATRRSAVPRTYTNDELPPEKVKVINDLGKELHDFVNSLDVRSAVETYLRGNIVFIDINTR